MSVIERLATSLGRRDEEPKKQLAKESAGRNAIGEIQELVVHLKDSNNRIQSDCIKVLYEIGYIKPELIAKYADEFLALLKSKNNRLVWGGMCALAAIAEVAADTLYQHWEEIRSAIEQGSVITVDRGIKTLTAIAKKKDEYETAIFPYLLKHLKTCRPKDVSRDAEVILSAVNEKNKAQFLAIVKERMTTLSAAQQKRLKKVLMAIEKRMK